MLRGDGLASSRVQGCFDFLKQPATLEAACEPSAPCSGPAHRHRFTFRHTAPTTAWVRRFGDERTWWKEARSELSILRKLAMAIAVGFGGRGCALDG